MDLSPAARTVSTLRAVVGVGGWLAPDRTWRVAGLGAGPVDGSESVVARLFAVRDLALAAGVLAGDPAVRRAALRAGVLVDSADVVASLLGARRGAPRGQLLGVAAGAATFVVLGRTALRPPD